MIGVCVFNGRVSDKNLVVDRELHGRCVVSSPIHRFFHDHPKGGKLCVECNQLFSVNSNNSAWKKHLCTHPLQWKQSCALISSRSDDSADEGSDPVLTRVLSSAAADSASTAASSLPTFRFPIMAVRSTATAGGSFVDLSDDGQAQLGRSVTSSISSRISLSASQTHTQPSIADSFSKAHDAVRDAAIAECFAIHSLPLSLIESPYFLSMIDNCRTSRSVLPTRKTLRIEQRALHDQRRLQLLDVLSSPQVCATIAIDGWTNVRHDKVTNILPIVEGRAYYWAGVVNSNEKNDARWLCSNIRPIFDSLINNVKIVAVVMDNEAVNRLVNVQTAQARHAFCHPCSVRLPHHPALRQQNFRLVGSARCTRRHAQDLQAVRSKGQASLTKIQEAWPMSRSLRLIKPCDTRWSSSLYAGRRLLTLRKAIDLVLPDIELDFWSNLQSLCDFLKPFQIATDACQKDTSTLVDVFRQVSVILQHLNQMKESIPFFASQQPAKNLILRQWKQHVKVDAVASTAMFSFSDDYERLYTQEERDSAQAFFFTFAVECLMFYQLSMRNADEVRRQLKIQWSDLSRRQGSFVSLDKEITDFTSSAGLVDVKGVWGMFKGKAPELHACAMALLSITASEAAVERSFSAQDIVHSKRRNRVDDEQVEAEMFIKVNTLALSRDVHVRPSWQELDEAAETIEELPAEHLFAPYHRCETKAEWALKGDGRRRPIKGRNAEVDAEPIGVDIEQKRDIDIIDAGYDLEHTAAIDFCGDEYENKYSDENESQMAQQAECNRPEEASRQGIEQRTNHEQHKQQTGRKRKAQKQEQQVLRRASEATRSTTTAKKKRSKASRASDTEEMQVTVASSPGAAASITTVTVTSSRTSAVSIGMGSSRIEGKWSRLPDAERALLRRFVVKHGVYCGQGSSQQPRTKIWLRRWQRASLTPPLRC